MEIWIGLIGGVLGAVAGGIVTFLTTRSRMLLELKHAYDRALRDKRLEHYQQLFHVSRCVPREWWPEQPTRQDLLRFRQEFHNWYFGESAGGLFLTPEAKDVYIRLQNELQAIAGARQDSPGLSERLPADQSEPLRKLASDLRHQLGNDVGTSQPPHFRWTRLGPTLAPPTKSSATQRGEFE
jgi:hypothetical protein